MGGFSANQRYRKSRKDSGGGSLSPAEPSFGLGKIQLGVGSYLLGRSEGFQANVCPRIPCGEINPRSAVSAHEALARIGIRAA